ncbi:MAG: hypothetical protein NC483_06475 [Ruminococcus sp.]|nr:hypothetical protein [Ruminococcus sp.]
MKFERNGNSRKYFLCGLILVVVLTITVTLITSKANYRMTASIPLTEGKVIASPYDINIVALYLDNIEQDSNTIIPNGYKINESQSYCYKGTNKNNKDSNVKLFTDELGNHSFFGISKSSKCILYLEKINYEVKIMSELLETHYTGRKTREEGTFNKTIENTTMGVIYEGEDDDGITYYFAGNPLDNWVEFGGYYWRIIRINGDGSIRLIYQGRAEDENGNKLEPQKSGSETQIGTSAFNNNKDDNAYAGFMYGVPNSSIYEETHKNVNKSTILQYLDNWFENSNINIKSENFKYIDTNAGFCNDRTPYSSNVKTVSTETSGSGKTTTYYGAYIRLRLGTYETPSALGLPTFKCTNIINDLFTYEKSNKGNHSLDYPVGLITADEVSYAGMVVSNVDNSTKLTENNYLYTKHIYWTLSPTQYNDSDLVYLFRVHSTGFLWDLSVGHSVGVRPVINLRADVEFTGDGTQFNPFKVVV